MGMDYAKKFADFSRNTLFKSMDNTQQEFIRLMGEMYGLTYQELRQITEITIDFNMWGSSTIEERWKYYEVIHQPKNGNAKKAILQDIKNEWLTLKSKPSIYEPETPKVKSIARKVNENSGENEVFGMCPVASEKTVCCNLRTIDAVQGCGLGCSYCSIQTFYEDGAIGIEINLADKLGKIELDPSQNYHIGSGQSSDSLAMGNKNGILDAQLDFARNNPNIILEFKTKTKNIDHFLSVDLPPNVFVCWSLNPQTIIDHEEHFTTSLQQRIDAAHRLAERGVIIGFHFHPIIYYDSFEKDYTAIVQTILSKFSSHEIGMISFGTLTFIKPAVKSLRTLGISSKVLQIPMEDAAGKFSYSMDIKEKLFGTVWNAFSSWHNKVFFYFCMEDKQLWESVMGKCYNSNDEFEDALFSSVSGKMTSRIPDLS